MIANKLKNALGAYGQSSVELDIEHASPHKLICMLYDGAMTAIQLAKVHMQNRDIGAKGAAISKAIAIIEEGLRNSLDSEKSEDLASKLDALYDYMSARLLMANLQNDPQILDEIYRLLADLKDAWSSIEKSQSETAEPIPEAQPAATSGRGSLSYGRV